MKPKMFIYFGSQTGTAMGFANQLGSEAVDKHFDAKVIDMDDFDEV
jgi:sulfite reductase alpha subunit-like flavoprotein